MGSYRLAEDHILSLFKESLKSSTSLRSNQILLVKPNILHGNFKNTILNCIDATLLFKFVKFPALKYLLLNDPLIHARRESRRKTVRSHAVIYKKPHKHQSEGFTGLSALENRRDAQTQQTPQKLSLCEGKRTPTSCQERLRHSTQRGGNSSRTFFCFITISSDAEVALK